MYPSYTMNNPWFEYNESDGKYYRFQYGGKHNGDSGQIAVRNVIFQYVEWGHYASTDYLNINVHKGGAGYVFTGGKCVPVSWKRMGTSDRPATMTLKERKLCLTKERPGSAL